LIYEIAQILTHGQPIDEKRWMRKSGQMDVNCRIKAGEAAAVCAQLGPTALQNVG
jgi:hypothetical protein